MKSFSKYQFVNNVGDQLLRIDQSQIEGALECFRTKPEQKMMVYLVAEHGGRSKGAARVGLAEMSTYRRNVSYEESTRQPGLKGRTIYEALPGFEKDYDKTLVLFASQSGTKATVLKEMRRIKNHVERRGKSDKLDFLDITGNADGEIGKFVKEYDGKILELKGIEIVDKDNYHELGFLGDEFEIKTAYVSREIVDMTCNGSSSGEFHENIENHFKEIGEKLNSEEATNFFDNLAEALGSQTNGFCVGAGGGSLLVAETARTRWDQLKRAYVNSGMYVMGGDHNPPPPLPGNKLLTISLSGGAPILGIHDESYIVDLCKISQKRGAENFCITGDENSPISELTPEKNRLILKEGNKKGSHYFYTDALLANSVAAIKTVDSLIEKHIIEKYISAAFKDKHHVG
jgi:hypothetical protein